MPALLPELTLPGLRAAVATGADVLEVDVLPTRDGLLVTRHEQQLEVSTDGHGRLLDTSTSELRRLHAVERWPTLRPASARWDGLLRVPALREVLALVAGGAEVGLAVELKDVALAQREGHDVVATLLTELAAAGRGRPGRRRL
jgi:glycerophosphoryl diester phosphodiesterase